MIIKKAVIAVASILMVLKKKGFPKQGYINIRWNCLYKEYYRKNAVVYGKSGYLVIIGRSRLLFTFN
jgi:hypothetical protein